MEKIWLPHYEAGIPAHINPDEFPSLNAMFAEGDVFTTAELFLLLCARRRKRVGRDLEWRDIPSFTL